MNFSRKAERWTLFVAFLSTAISGLALHLAGHFGNHALWHNWAVGHVIAGAVWLAATILHIKRRLQWYRLLVTNGLKNKSLITLLLSIVFAVTATTGIVLLAAVDGANSPVGLWHYKSGLVLIVFSALHVYNRGRIFLGNRQPAASRISGAGRRGGRQSRPE